MPHFPKPYFRKGRGVWMVQIRGRQHNLGPDKIAAFQVYHQLMASPQPPKMPALQPDAGPSVCGILEKYLAWCREHRAEETYEWYRWRLQKFAESIDVSLTVAQLQHFHIDECLLKHPSWSGGTKHGLARAVQRAFLWARKKGYVNQNPVGDYEKARSGKRRTIVSPAEFDTVLELAGSQEFKDLLLFTWETASRPQESLICEKQHVELHNSRIVLPEEDAKGEQCPRIIYLSDKAVEIVIRLMAVHPEGALFRNTGGAPWTTDAVNCAFVRVQLRLGLRRMDGLKKLFNEKPEKAKAELAAIHRLTEVERNDIWAAIQHPNDRKGKQIKKLMKKIGCKYCLYHLRHSWLDRALKRGVDALTCAILMGHRDPSTIAKVYQHLCQSPDFLKEQARKAAS